MFLKVKMYLYDHNHLISRTVTQAKLTKRSINKLQETQKKEKHESQAALENIDNQTATKMFAINATYEQDLI